MASIEEEMAAAVAAQKARSEQLKQSVQELQQVGRQGEQAGQRARQLGLGLVAAVALVLTAILWSDPRSRAASIALIPCLLLGGLWSYYRKR